MNKRQIISAFWILLMYIILLPYASTTGENELTIISPSEVYEEELFNITILSDGQAVANATVTINSMLNTTNMFGVTYFYSPEVQNNTTFRIDVIADNFLSNNTTIKVINHPKLYLCINSNSYDYYTYFPPIVIIAGSDSFSLEDRIPMTLNINGINYSIKNNKEFIFNPETSGEYTITAHCEGHRSSETTKINVIVYHEDYTFAFFYFGISMVFSGILAIILFFTLKKIENKKNK